VDGAEKICCGLSHARNDFVDGQDVGLPSLGEALNVDDEHRH